MMSSGVFPRDGYLSQLKAALRSTTSHVLIIHGDSGVGKSTLVNLALDQLDASEKVLRYSFVNDGLSFKTYLNEVLFSVFAQSSLIAKLFRKRFRLTTAHIEPVKRLSITFFNKAYDAPLNEKKPRPRGFVFESSHYRLNGVPNQEFFNRLWRHLKNSGVSYINITNIEKADPESKELILILVQTAPKSIQFVLEYGIFGGNIGRYHDFEIAARAIAPKLANIRIDPFDEGTAEQFYQTVRAVNPHLPPFDYTSNRGNPLAIIYDLREIDARYRPSRVITALMRRASTQNALLLIAMLDGLTTAVDEFSSLAKRASIKFSLRELISTGVVRANQGLVEFSHPYFSSYIKIGYASEICALALTISKRAKENNPLIASYLMLRYGMHRNDASYRADLVFLVKMICEAMDRRDMHILAVLLPLITEFVDMLDERQTVALHLINLQFRIYNFRIEDADFRYTGTRADSLCHLLMLQHLYHSNRFFEAIEIIDSDETRDHLRRLSTHPLLFGHFSEVSLAIKAACKISVGSWEEAAQLLRRVDRRSCLGRVGGYLEIFDGFIGGYEIEARKLRNLPKKADTYTTAKVLHNIITSGICAYPIDNSHSRAIISTLIPLFVESRSREITYCLNNLAVCYLLEKKPDKAIEILDEMRPRTFEVYDEVCCELNFTIANVMLGHVDEGARHISAAVSLIKRKAFTDPYFVGLVDYTFALIELAEGAQDRAKIDLERLQFSDVISDREGRLIDKIERAREICTRQFGVDQITSLFEPALLHFWDFNTPLVDQSTLEAFVWSS